MFPRMRRVLANKGPRIGLELQAKGTTLSDRDRQALDRFLDA